MSIRTTPLTLLIAAPGDDPAHVADLEQQPPLVLLARPVAIGREVQAGGQVLEREAADGERHRSP
jgi:hypothetical protein